MARIEEALALLGGRFAATRGSENSEAPDVQGTEGMLRDWPPGEPDESVDPRSVARRRWEGARPPSNVVVGRRFEHLVREALLVHPGEWGRFEEIWLWHKWPGYWGPDSGIDLVGRLTEDHGGGLTAIQCKVRKGQIPTTEIKSFLSASGTSHFSGRLLVTNSPSIQATGQREMLRAAPRCELLHTRDMDDWVPDWTEFVHRRIEPGAIRFERHDLRPYQEEALRAIRDGFARCPRGKLILPCGTGKSFIALRAAEQAVAASSQGGDHEAAGGSVLFLVPSIALMGQTMREWSRQRDQGLRHSYLAVCSDATAGRRETRGGADLAGDLAELHMPVTTDPAKLAESLAAPLPPGTMRVVFSTYHSTPVVAEALARVARTSSASGGAATASAFRGFDLIVADEAHRTTGLSEASASAAEKRRNARARYQGISPFNLVHHDDHLPARRRLYMTATPRVFTAKQRRDIEDGDRYDDADSYSMDDPEVYGAEFYRMSFADAIDDGWLSDYQVLVIARSIRDYELAAGDGGVVLPDGTALDTESAVKLGGCWDALATPESEGTLERRRTGEVRAEWGAPARSAIAFCGSIKTSRKVAESWQRVADWHRERNDDGDFLSIAVDHLDASTPAVARATLIGELRRHAQAGDDPPVEPKASRAHESDSGLGAPSRAKRPTCRVLTNVRVLSEGVDVPALDAVVFLESRSSPIDVTQAVGRVMRRAPGKDQGYIVIPVIVDEFGDGTPEERARRLLREGNFQPVWEVVRALRAHDERIDYWLNAKRADRIRLLSNRIVDDRREADEPELPVQISFEFGDSFASMLLDHCGDRDLYATWGKRAAVICRQVELRVKRLVTEHPAIGEAFARFRDNLQRLVGERQITDAAAAEMVSQHVVTIPIFDHVVAAEGFAEKNPLGQAMGSVLDVFEEHGHTFTEELRPLTRAYRSMERAFRGAASGAERLNVLKEIYESFFKEAMPAAVKSLGIVYTPVEIVDFMLRAVDAVCRDQFGKGLTAEGVHVLDPFTGTGTFLNRLLAAKDAAGEYLIRADDLDRKYGLPSGSGAREMHAALRAPGELHANEIVLLAYYIAALKIEEARHERKAELDAAQTEGAAPQSSDGAEPARTYAPFGGMVLTDTFLMSEKQAEIQFNWKGLDEAGRRVREQNRRRIKVIVGNPPWSAGKKAAGDESVEGHYPEVSARVADTYVRELAALGGKSAVKAAGNLFVKAVRWASDRLQGGDGIVCFVHPNSLADAPSLAGMRKVLRDEFTDVFVVNLRGNAYKSGAEWEREGDKVFGQGSRNGVQITLLARNRGHAAKDGATANPHAPPARLHYAEVPDRLTLDEKFHWLEELGNVLAPGRFREIPVNASHDWVDLGDPTWKGLMPLCSSSVEAADAGSVSQDDVLGLATNLDAYAYSFSWLDLCERMEALIAEFNRALETWRQAGRPKKGTAAFDEVISSDSLHAIKWTDRLKGTLLKGEPLDFDARRIREVLYRPFTKLWLYEDYRILSAGGSVSRMFPRSLSLPPPPPHTEARRSASTRPNRFRSESLPRRASSISAPPAGRPGSSPAAGHPDHGALEPDRVRGIGGQPVGGPALPRPGSPGSSAASSGETMTGAAAILVSSPSNQALPGALAARTLPDLHLMGAGQTTRALPATRSSDRR